MEYPNKDLGKGNWLTEKLRRMDGVWMAQVERRRMHVNLQNQNTKQVVWK
ncbi:hypothetical protein [Pseudoalteromonas luteoviolacea]|uniref:Uncharacterized protein n=1 Tax=Pseudoalteromonas luteoviolacea NCIMB 1942 TaxID=1365253 RepID=A0A161XYG4_9GAMM|nr:hypothetical protein [Pseudoalteromonas luteoviolacea]KZN48369.1 hypothetical protein N482_07830 [Pseudoalteromonas luteoviolacea NCIMB 1942]